MYPVQYEAEHVEQHSRLTTFFRLFLAIPAFFLTMFYVLAAGFVAFAAWFAILFTGRYPQGMYDFVAGALRNSMRVYGYSYLVTDAYPPFNGRPDDAYPIRIHVGPPKERYSRLKTAFRLIVGIPVYLINYALSLVAQFGALAAWFVILFTGKLPSGLQEVIDLGLRYQARASAYFLLMTEDWPPLSEDSGTPAAVGPAPGAAPAAEATPLPHGFEAPGGRHPSGLT